jgi:hypothetical protein
MVGRFGKRRCEKGLTTWVHHKKLTISTLGLGGGEGIGGGLFGDLSVGEGFYLSLSLGGRGV